jgi:hypothetical protein
VSLLQGLHRHREELGHCHQHPFCHQKEEMLDVRKQYDLEERDMQEEWINESVEMRCEEERGNPVMSSELENGFLKTLLCFDHMG